MTNSRKNPSDIHYLRTGKPSQAVVFVHGFLEDLRMWDGFIQRIPGYSIIKLDLPGFGQSATKEKISITGYADVVKKILDAENIDQAILVGHSMGGYTTLAFAKKYPKLLKGICLFHSQPYADSQETNAKRLKSITFVETHGETAYAHATIPNLFAPAFAKKYPKIVQPVIAYAQENSPEGIIAALKAMKNRKDTSEVLVQLNCPVQFIIGTEDKAIHLDASLKQTTLPLISNIHILKGIGHMGHLEATRKTQKVVRDFVSFCDSMVH